MIELKRSTLLIAYLSGSMFLSGVVGSNAGSYYVSPIGSNANTGSLENPWRTVGYAATRANPGDIVRVQAGIYHERVPIKRSGTSGAWVNYVADGRATVRGFDLFDVSYIRIVGFEITHTNLAANPYNRGVLMSGVCSHIDIIDNWIHDVQNNCIWAAGGSTPTWITIRGNSLSFPGRVPGIYSNSEPAAIKGVPVTPHHWLIEYNTASNACDFVAVFGTNFIMRNNFFHDYRDSYYTNPPNWNHSDMFQCGSGNIVVGTRFHIVERNFCGDSVEANSHFLLHNDTEQAGDTNIVIRGNVAFNFGEVGIHVTGADRVCSYNNTFYKLGQAFTGSPLRWYKLSSSTDYPLGVMCVNTIIHDWGMGTESGQSVYVQTADASVVTNNLGYLTKAHPSFVALADPTFVDAASHDFRLKPGSFAINAGTNVVWITSVDGGGYSFTVNDSQLLCDGWEMTDGDTITVGATTTTITNIDLGNNLIGVRDSLTWTNGQAVHWGKYATEDIGALPYGSTELRAATLSRAQDTYTVTTTGDARGVWFYVDGIPSVWDASAPFSATIPSGRVKAKAYALYAQPDPVVTATAENSVSGPLPPQGLKVLSSPP